MPETEIVDDALVGETRARWLRFTRRAVLQVWATFALFVVFAELFLPDVPPGDPRIVIVSLVGTILAAVSLALVVRRKKTDGGDLIVAAFDITTIGLWALTEMRGGTLRAANGTVMYRPRNARRHADEIDLSGCRFVVIADRFGRCYVDAYGADGLVVALFVAGHSDQVARALTGEGAHRLR